MCTLCVLCCAAEHTDQPTITHRNLFSSNIDMLHKTHRSYLVHPLSETQYIIHTIHPVQTYNMRAVFSKIGQHSENHSSFVARATSPSRTQTKWCYMSATVNGECNLVISRFIRKKAKFDTPNAPTTIYFTRTESMCKKYKVKNQQNQNFIDRMEIVSIFSSDHFVGFQLNIRVPCVEGRASELASECLRVCATASITKYYIVCKGKGAM